VNKKGRFVLQRQARSSLTWRTVLRVDSKEAASMRFLAHTTQIRAGCSLRLIDEWEDLILAKHTAPVHTGTA